MKKHKGQKLIFRGEMYGNPYGSLVVRWFWYYGGQFEEKELKRLVKIANKRWDIISLKPQSFIDFTPDDKDFFEKTIALFELPDMGSEYLKETVKIKSKYNMIFCPLVDGVVHPIREDGWTGYTYDNGEISPALASNAIEEGEKDNGK